MANDIDVKYSGHGDLFLVCDEQAFARLRDLVVAEAGGTEVVEGHPEFVRSIQISVVSAAAAKPSYLRDRLALLGCGLGCTLFGIASFGVFSVLMVGAGTIMGWVR